MASPKSEDLTERVLNQIALNHGFTNARLEFSAATEEGDNFVGQIARCVLTDDNSEKQLHLIVKLPPADEALRKIIIVERLFKNEIYMYGTALPTLADLFKKQNLLPKDALFPCTARTYALLDEEQDKLIVMEDMKQKGFVMKNRHVGLDKDHCYFVMKQMARIHAASLALQRDNPSLHDTLAGNLLESLFCAEELNEHFRYKIERFRVAIDRHFPLGSPIRNKVEAFLGNFQSNMKKIVGRNSELCCITHGDLWVNNILFKHKEGTDTIEEICFLDLQISRFCSPVADIWYFLALCTRQSTRKSYDGLIKCYYESLCSFLKDLGHGPEEIVPWNLLQEELRKYGTYGWAIAVIILPAIIREEADIETIEKQLEENSFAHIGLPNQVEARFVELLEDAEEHGLFWD